MSINLNKINSNKDMYAIKRTVAYIFLKEGIMKIGIDLGGSHIAIGVVNSKGKIVKKVETKISGLPIEEKKEVIEKYIIQNCEKLRQEYEVTSIGIAVPGTVDSKKIIRAANIGIEDYEISQIIKEKLKLPILLANDAKCAALAENIYGCLKETNRALFLTLGTGIGAAVIINNKLLDTGDLPRSRSRTYGNRKKWFAM